LRPGRKIRQPPRIGAQQDRGQLAGYQKELDATPQEQRERRERLAWQIRRIKKRMAEVEARIATLGEAR